MAAASAVQIDYTSALSGKREATREHARLRIVKLIWIYILMFLFEGAIRKWVLPSLAAPLLFMRDPVILIAYGVAYKHRLFPSSRLIAAGCFLSVACIGASLIAAPETPLMPLAGLRATFLHLLLIPLFVHLNRLELRKMIKVLIFLSIPMAILMAVQYRAGQSSWLNAGAGIDATQITGLEGDKVRASGTFSFVTGPVAYYGLVSAIALGGFMGAIKIKPAVLWGATMSTILAVAVSGSRTFILNEAIAVLAAIVFVPILQPRFTGLVAKLVITLVVALLLVSLTPSFQEGWHATGTRLGNTGASYEGGFEGEINERVIGNFTRPFDIAGDVPPLGHGYGLVTNVGQMLAYGRRGVAEFGLDSEREWTRHVLEVGPILGIATIAFRCAVFWSLAGTSVRAGRRGNLMPFLLVASTATGLIYGLLGQPNVLGGVVVSCGFALAYAKFSRSELIEDENIGLRGPKMFGGLGGS